MATMPRSRSRATFLGISALAAIWFAAAAVATSDIGDDLRWYIIGFYSGVALLVAWLVAIVIFRNAKPSLRLAVAVPLFLALGILLSELDRPSNPLFRLRFLASRPALARAAKAALVSEPTASRQRIGLFAVDRVQVVEGQVEFEVYCGLFSTCGVGYVPPGRPVQPWSIKSQPLGGPWHHFVRRW